MSLSWAQAAISSSFTVSSWLKSKGNSLEQLTTLNTPFEKSFAALTRPDPIMVAWSVVVADSTVPRLLGGLHGQAPFLVGTGHPLPDAVAPVIRAWPVNSKKKKHDYFSEVKSHPLLQADRKKSRSSFEMTDKNNNLFSPSVLF